jgi:putative flavoprotein involved in K+ transport
MGDYLEAYARRFELPVRTGVRVERLYREGGSYVLATNRGRLEAPKVVVAMSRYQRPRVPRFARDLRPDIVQLHSMDYRGPASLREGAVLVVGAGNSGSEIALEAARGHHPTWVAGRDTGHLPFRIAGTAGRFVLVPLVLRFLFHRVLTIRTPLGRRVRPQVLRRGGPLIRVMPRDLRAAGIERVPRVAGVHDGLPRLEDGRVLAVDNVVWCTGFHPAFSWIDRPVIDGDGEPRQFGGVCPDAPGLYFVGLHVLSALASGMIHGVARDAERVVSAIA